MIWLSLCYPLAISSIPKATAVGITKKLYKALLPKLGASCSYPTVFHHTPLALFGLGLPNLYWEQGAAALHLFFEVGNGHSGDSHLLQCSLEQVQLELGIFIPFFQADFTCMASLTHQLLGQVPLVLPCLLQILPLHQVSIGLRPFAGQQPIPHGNCLQYWTALQQQHVVHQPLLTGQESPHHG